MKTIIATALAFILSLSVNAQSKSVYYTPVNETMEIGFGFNPETRKCIISIIEESKEDVDFDLNISTPFGNIMEKTFSDGDITVIPKTRKVNYYECSYELNAFEMARLQMLAHTGAKISVNGVEMSSREFMDTIKGIFM